VPRFGHKASSIRLRATGIATGGIRVQVTKLKVADVELELFDSGQRPGQGSGQAHPILFLHGGGGFSPQQPFVAPLSEKRRVVAPSHPGFGKSGLPDWLDSIDDIAHIYLELMDVLKLDRIDLVGCSIGGWIAADMATKSPERFRRIVFAAPVGVKVGPPDRLDIPDIFAMPESDVAKLIFHDPERMKPDTAKMSEDELAAMFRARETLALLTWEPWMHNPKLKRRLHRIAAPALFIRGESDGLVSQEYLEAYARMLPDARTLTIKAAGHVPQLEQPKVFATAVLEFLGE
jgi:pimeloyl-ACP methyl ester carboxylesterase